MDMDVVIPFIGGMAAWATIMVVGIGSYIRAAFIFRSNPELSPSQVQSMATSDVVSFPFTVIRHVGRRMSGFFEPKPKRHLAAAAPTLGTVAHANREMSVIDPSRIEPRIVPLPQLASASPAESSATVALVDHEPTPAAVHGWSDGNAALEQDFFFDDGLVPA